MITLIHGDCITALRSLPEGSVDTIFADPPYNTCNKADKTVNYDRNTDFAKKNWKNFYADWDCMQDDAYTIFTQEWIQQAWYVLKDGGTIWICGSFHNIPTCAEALNIYGFFTIQWVSWCIPNAYPHLSGKKMANSNQTLIWARKGDRHYYDYGRAKAYNDGKNLRDYWLINNDCMAGRLYKHPAKKPMALVTRAIDISTSKPDGIVLDPFAGSGTTLVAAAALGLSSIGIEKESIYIDMIKTRLTVHDHSYTIYPV